MFVSDLLRLDSVILFLMEPEQGAVGAGEIGDALAEAGLDVPTYNVSRELQKMQLKALLTCTGHTLRNGRHRMRVYELTEMGRGVAGRRRALFERLLHDPPKVQEAPLPRAEGWQ